MTEPNIAYETNASKPRTYLCVVTFRNGFAIGFETAGAMGQFIDELRRLYESKISGERAPGNQRFAVWAGYAVDHKRAETVWLDVDMDQDQVMELIKLIGSDLAANLVDVDPAELCAMVNGRLTSEGRDDE